MNEPIIVVNQDEQGNINYRVRTSLLDTKGYAIIMASIIKCVGRMFEEESNGNYPQDRVVSQLLGYMQDELAHPYVNMTVQRMQ